MQKLFRLKCSNTGILAEGFFKRLCLLKKIPKFCTFLYLSTFTGEGILWPQKSTPHHSEDVAMGKPNGHAKPNAMPRSNSALS